MIDVLIFVALWCGTHGPENNEKITIAYRTMNEVQVCRERLMKCASRSSALGMIFSNYDTDIYWCAYKEKLQP